MKILVGAFLVALVVGALAIRSDASHLRCHTSNVRGFVAIKADPPHLVGTLPSRFTSDPGYFSAKYNCTRQGVQVRRVDQGLYDVRFPGIDVRVAVSDAISDEGVSSSVQPLSDGVVRVSLRGPLGGDDIASRRDVPFQVIVY